MFAVLLLLSAPADEHYTYPPVRKGGAEITFSVQVPEGNGRPVASYSLTVESGPQLQVEAPELTDPAGAWSARRSSAWSEADETVTWTERIELEQAKPGVLPLPSVKLRFRAGDGDWQQVEWQDVLRDVRDLPGPSALPPSPSAGGRWFGAAAFAAVVLALLAVPAVLLRRRPSAPPSPESQALRELERLQTAADARGQQSEWFATQLADVLRRYVTEAFGLPALRRTTVEFLEAVKAAPPLAGEEKFLTDFFDRCDLLKFAGVRPEEAERRELVDAARAFVRRTASAADGNGTASAAGDK